MPDLEHVREIERAEYDERQATADLDAVLDELRVAMSLHLGNDVLEGLFHRADEARARRQAASERRHRATLAAVLSRPSVRPAPRKPGD